MASRGLSLAGPRLELAGQGPERLHVHRERRAAADRERVEPVQRTAVRHVRWCGQRDGHRRDGRDRNARALSYVVFRWTGSASGKTYLHLAGPNDALVQASGVGFGSNINSFTGSVNISAVRAAAPTTTPGAIYAFAPGNSAVNTTVAYNLANLSEVDTVGPTTVWPSSIDARTLYVGAQTGTSNFAPVEIVEIVTARIKPTSTQLLQLYEYFNFRYLLDPPMSYARSLDVMATTGTTGRVAGGGFNPMSSAQIVIAGTPTAVTTTYLNSGSLSLSGIPSLAAGQYDLIVTNMNSGQAITVSNAINVTTQLNPATIFGRLLNVWARMDMVTLNGSTVAACTDLACIGNAIVQATPAAQPTYNASDANFAGLPTATFSATSTMATAATLQLDTGSHSYFFAVTSRQTSKANREDLFVCNDTMRTDAGVGKPYLRSASNSPAGPVAWPTDETNVTITQYVSNLSTGTNTENYEQNINNGTAQTFAGGTNTSWTAAVARLGGTLNPFTGQIAELIVLDGVPTPTQIAQYWLYAARY